MGKLAESNNRDDNNSFFPSCLNVPVGFSDLLQWIGTVNDGFELSFLNKIKQQSEIAILLLGRSQSGKYDFSLFASES